MKKKVILFITAIMVIVESLIVFAEESVQEKYDKVKEIHDAQVLTYDNPVPENHPTSEVEDSWTSRDAIDSLEVNADSTVNETTLSKLTDSWNDISNNNKGLGADSDGNGTMDYWLKEETELQPAGTWGQNTGTSMVSEHYSAEVAEGDNLFALHYDYAKRKTGDTITGLFNFWNSDGAAEVFMQDGKEIVPMPFNVFPEVADKFTYTVVNLESPNTTAGKVVSTTEYKRDGAGSLAWYQQGPDIKNITQSGYYAIVAECNGAKPNVLYYWIDRDNPRMEMQVNGEAVADKGSKEFKINSGESLTFTFTNTFKEDYAYDSGLWLNEQSGFFGLVVVANGRLLHSDNRRVGDARVYSGKDTNESFSHSITVTNKNGNFYIGEEQIGGEEGEIIVSGSIQDRSGNKNTGEYTIKLTQVKKDKDKDPKHGNADVWAHLYSSSTTVTPTKNEPYGRIYSDIYDVEKGIPTSEYLNYEIRADKYLYDITY